MAAVVRMTTGTGARQAGLRTGRSWWTAAMTALILPWLLLAGCMDAQRKGGERRSIGVSSGLIGGHYNQVARRITSEFNTRAPGLRFHAFPSVGSLRNMERLKDGRADLAIVQRDVLVSQYYDRVAPFTEVEVVAPLFPEALQVLVHVEGITGIVGFPEFADLIEHRRISAFAIGPEGSITNTTARTVFDMLELQAPPFLYVESPTTEALRAFENGGVQALAVLSAAPVTGLHLPPDFGLAVLSLNKEETDVVTSYLKDLEPIRLDMDHYLPGDGRTVTALGTWALLVGRSGISSELERMTGADPFDVVMSALEFGSLTNRQLFNGGTGVLCQRLDHGWQVTLQDRPIADLFKGIALAPGLHAALSTHEPGNRWSALWIVAACAMISLIGGSLAWRNKANKSWSRATMWWRRYQQFFFAGLIFFSIALVLPFLIDHLERAFCRQYGLRSAFLDVSLEDKYTWLLVLSLSGNDNGLFPLSGWARVITSTSMVLQYINVAFLAVHTFMKERRRRKRLNGLAMTPYTDHLVVCGWNATAAKLIRDLVNDQHAYAGERRSVALVHPRATEYLRDDSALQPAFEDGRYLWAVNDDPKRENAMLTCRIERAHTVILLADADCQDPDERTLVRASAIARYLSSRNEPGRSAYVIAEVVDGKQTNTFLANEVDEVVCSAHFTSNVLFQSSINHGVSSVFSELIDHEAGNEFYTIPVKDDRQLLGRTFDELLVWLREREVLLLGIGSAEDSTPHVPLKPVHGLRHTLNRFLTRVRPGVQVGRVMINPTNRGTDPYRTQRNDQLFVIAESKGVIDRMLKR